MTTPLDSGDLQFDSVVPRTDGDTAASAETPCTLCGVPLESEYYDVNGRTVCRTCSENVAKQAATPRDMTTLLRSFGAGIVACIFGAALYFAVIAVSGFEIGLVAIAIGYMVGYAVRVGARGRGGRRFQVLALVLTYFAVGLAYSSLAFKELVDTPASATTETSALEQSGDGEIETGGEFAVALLQLLAFTFVLPVLVVAGSMPGGIISAAIIGFGMMQAWKMTAAPAVTVSGPYRLATPAAG